MKNRIPFVLVAIIFFTSFFGLKHCQAQAKTAMLGVNGLTCSACSRTVEMSLRKLLFIKDVDMNLENTEGKLIFPEGADVDFSKIAKAVTDAGFSVRYLSVFYDFKNVTINNGFCLPNNKYNLQFVSISNQTLDGEKEINFLGQEFLPKSEFNKIKQSLVNTCSDKNQKVYYVTLK
ncbi:MAG: heavy-metal-associated domain-containing protein [Bacteroidetes bacterium]|nr:heavy-metal-associated domain-containing protein [Bacteroidota bacterium]MBP6401363.1 heavy-metal-associated domain-containing protein [Bacteroidia bacterium]MBK6836965.1 heavy-metal-associated domain-containing protein [Bacteroidota bacterium]MBK9523632.1 heavy-metal-associated domain-containing protein [Bacteroidota bacterium]MBK9541378.1 heavy-metal-associated domain-containing protein [Bacteroidota bacterium]